MAASKRRLLLATLVSAILCLAAERGALAQPPAIDRACTDVWDGAGHCRGGDGPDTFDGLGALEAWVEHGEAPARIEAAKIADGKTVRTRPLCPYPAVARFKGSGSSDEAANFECVSTR